MKAFKTIFGIGACIGILAASIGSISAQVYTGTLAGLVASGGSLTIGDKTFSGFAFQATGLTAFDPTAISVTASESGGVDYLTWTGNISLISSGTTTADLVLNYIVTANPGSINMIDQSYTLGNAINGLLAVDETVSAGAFGGTIVAYSHLDTGDLSDPPAEPVQGDNLNINPAQSVLYVTKDITLGVIPPVGAAGSVTITQVEQSFHQVPEPTVMALGSLSGGLLLFLRSRRQARRN
ncbi:MAG TPA: hypothetical protein VMH87_03385 [Pseudomonadales bacterium]|nr:hypothetical protein [Pseudomonadales bacterium]